LNFNENYSSKLLRGLRSRSIEKTRHYKCGRVWPLGISLSRVFLDPEQYARTCVRVLSQNWAPEVGDIKKTVRPSEVMPRIRKWTLLCLETDLKLLPLASGVTARHFCLWDANSSPAS